jgi:hypothetical protein
MPNRLSRHRRWWLLLAAPLLALHAPSAAAQTSCTTRTECVDQNLPSADRPPVVTVQVPADAVTTSRVAVTFTFSDDHALNPATATYTVSGGTLVAAPVWQWNKQSTSAFAGALVDLAPGTNHVEAQVCDTGARCDSGAATIYYNAPAPPGAARAHPSINTAVHRVDSRNLATCDGCTETVMTYTLPAYTSNDQAHAVTLFYSTHQANPRGFVDLEVTDAGSDPAAYMTLQVEGAGGVLATLDNGTSTQHYRTGPGISRLAASWPAAEKSTGMYDYTVIVRAYWSDGEVRESRAAVKVPIVNERNSPFGAGVTVVGHERIFWHADGALVTDGAGGIQWFARTACTAQNICSYQSPPGDHSRLEYVNGYWDRRWQNGSSVQYFGTSHIARRINRFGQQANYHHDGPVTRLLGVGDYANLNTVFTYGAGGYVESLTDPFGRTVTLSYNGTNLARVVGPDGARVLELSYDGSHRLSHWYDARNGLTTATYDPASGKVRLLEAPAISDGVTTGRPTVQVRSREATLLPLAGTGTAAVPARRVTADSVRVTTTSPLGEVTRVEVDPFGGARRVEAPRDTVVIGRNTRGQVTSVADGKGNSTTYTYQTSFPYRLSTVTVQGPDGGVRLHADLRGVRRSLPAAGERG